MYAFAFLYFDQMNEILKINYYDKKEKNLINWLKKLNCAY